MNLLRLFIWKEFQHLRRDPGSIRLLLGPPLIQLFVLGYAMNTEVKNTPYAVLDRCQCPASASLLASTASSPLFKFKGFARSESELREWMDEGRIRAALLIPPDFSHRVEERLQITPTGFPEGEGAPIGIWVDGQDASSSGVARGYLSAILNQWSQEKLQQKLRSEGKELRDLMPFKVETRIAFNPLLESSWYMVPGIAVILITMVTCMMTAFSIVREKENGTLEQLLVTPIKPIHIVLGKAFPFFIIGQVQLFFALTVARLWFHIPFRGSYWELALFCAAYMLSSLGIGILISTVARTLQQALFITWFFLLFFMLLSGFFLPVENMPGWVQIITRANPVRYFMFVLRSILLKGSGFKDLWHEGMAMLIIGGVVFTSATALFHRKSG